jgi:hypothetical protein
MGSKTCVTDIGIESTNITEGNEKEEINVLPIASDAGTIYEYPTGLSLAAILCSLFFGTFLMALDTTIITVALPEITTSFNALAHVDWYGSAYLITLTAFQPISGSMYKMFDPKTTYLVFMVIFESK